MESREAQTRENRFSKLKLKSYYFHVHLQMSILFVDGVSRGDGALSIEADQITWTATTETVEFKFKDMALHAYSLGNESESRPHLLIQLLAADEDEAGSEVRIVLSSQAEVEAAFNLMNKMCSESDTSTTSEWFTAKDLVSA